MTKLRSSAYEALHDVVEDGMTIAVGGFGLSGNPFGLIDALRDTGARDLTIVSNNMGTDGFGLGILLESKQVRKVIASYVGENKLFAKQYLEGEIEVDLTPQGTLAERLRAGGAGIPAFYTPTGFGTPAADGKPTAEFDGKHCVLERAIVADIGLVHAHTADAEGNLRYRYTSQNFNPLAAMSGRTTDRRGRDHPGRQLHRPGLGDDPGDLRPPAGPGGPGAQADREAHGPAAGRCAEQEA